MPWFFTTAVSEILLYLVSSVRTPSWPEWSLTKRERWIDWQLFTSNDFKQRSPTTTNKRLQQLVHVPACCQNSPTFYSKVFHTRFCEWIFLLISSRALESLCSSSGETALSLAGCTYGYVIVDDLRSPLLAEYRPLTLGRKIFFLETSVKRADGSFTAYKPVNVNQSINRSSKQASKQSAHQSKWNSINHRATKKAGKNAVAKYYCWHVFLRQMLANWTRGKVFLNGLRVSRTVYPPSLSVQCSPV